MMALTMYRRWDMLGPNPMPLSDKINAARDSLKHLLAVYGVVRSQYSVVCLACAPAPPPPPPSISSPSPTPTPYPGHLPEPEREPEPKPGARLRSGR